MEGARSESFTHGSQLDNYGGRVVASDISGPMLAAAAATPADPGRAPIEYLECPADAIAADDDSFDVVLCQQGIQFFGDRAAAVREMRRTARPGGVVVVEVWGSADEVTAALFGTPFGPLVAALPVGQQRQVRDDLARRLGASADGVTVRTVSNVGRGVK